MGNSLQPFCLDTAGYLFIKKGERKDKKTQIVYKVA